MVDDTRDLRIAKYNLEIKKRNLQYKIDDYSDNSKTYNEQYIPIFVLGLVSHLVFGSINDAYIAFVDLLSMGFMCGSGIALILSNIFYTLPLISYKKELNKMESIIKNLDSEIEKGNINSLNKEKEITRTEYSYNNKKDNYDKYQYDNIKEEKNNIEHEEVKKLQLKKY